jgi:hypothetical protein
MTKIVALALLCSTLIAGCVTDEDDDVASEIHALPIDDSRICFIFTPYSWSGDWVGWHWDLGDQVGSSCYLGPDRVSCTSQHALCGD